MPAIMRRCKLKTGWSSKRINPGTPSGLNYLCWQLSDGVVLGAVLHYSGTLLIDVLPAQKIHPIKDALGNPFDRALIYRYSTSCDPKFDHRSTGNIILIYL